MDFINASYFTKGPRKIDNARGPLGQSLVAQAASTAIEGYIEYYQRDFLCRVFGFDLGNEYAEYLDGKEKDDTKEAILDHLREPFADYVMYHFLRGQQTASSTAGEKQLKGGNTAASVAQRQVMIWNQLAELMKSFNRFAQNSYMCPVCADESLLTKINVYGL